MAKVQSTCKIFDLFGVEIGDYAVVLEDGTVVIKNFEDQEPTFELVADDSGEVEMNDELQERADDINTQMATILDLTSNAGMATSDASTSLDEYDEEEEA